MQAYPKAAMYQLAEEGYSSPFAQLVSCMISIRTYIANALRETNLQASVSIRSAYSAHWKTYFPR